MVVPQDSLKKLITFLWILLSSKFYWAAGLLLRWCVLWNHLRELRTPKIGPGLEMDYKLLICDGLIPVSVEFECLPGQSCVRINGEAWECANCFLNLCLLEFSILMDVEGSYLLFQRNVQAMSQVKVWENKLVWVHSIGPACPSLLAPAGFHDRHFILKLMTKK